MVVKLSGEAVPSCSCGSSQREAIPACQASTILPFGAPAEAAPACAGEVARPLALASNSGVPRTPRRNVLRFINPPSFANNQDSLDCRSRKSFRKRGYIALQLYRFSRFFVKRFL